MARGLLGTAAIRIVADATSLNKGFGKATMSMKKFSIGMRQAGTSLTAIGTQAAVVAGTIAAAFAPIAKVGAKFEQSLAVVKAVTGETGAAFDSIAAKARQLGEDTRFTATQAADAMIELGRAGLNASEIIATTGDVLNLASVGMIELSTAAGITTRIMRAFNLTASESTRIVDVLTVAANNANTTVELLGESFKFVAPTAASVGISLEETAAALSVLANAGLRGTLAGTALNQAILQMGKGTEKAAEVLGRFGLSLDDVNPKTRTLTEIIQALSATSIGAIDLVEAFGIRGGRALSSLVNQGAGALDIMNTKFGETHQAAAIAAATIEDTFLGRIRRLKSVFESLQLDIFGLFADDAKKFADSLILVIQRIRQWVKSNKELTKQYTKMALKIGLIAGAIAAIAIPLGIIVGAVANLGIILGPMLTGLSTLITGFLAAAGKVAAGGGLSTLLNVLKLLATPLFIIIAAITVIVRNLDTFKAIAISVFKIFMSIFNSVGSIFKAVWAIVSPLLSLLEAIFLPILGLIVLAVQFLAGALEVGFLFFEMLSKAIVKAIAEWPILGGVIETVGTVLKGLGAAIAGTGKAISNMVQGGKDAVASLFGFETSAEKAAKAARILAEKVRVLNRGIKRQIEHLDKISARATTWLVVNQQILGIQEKANRASIAELKALEKLLEKRDKMNTSTTTQLNIAERNLRAIARRKEEAIKLGRSVQDLEVRENILKKTVESLNAEMIRSQDVMIAQGDTLADSKEKVAAMIAEQEKAIDVQNRLAAAREAAAEAAKSLDKIEESLANVGLTALEAKIKGVIALRGELNKNLKTLRLQTEIQIEQLNLNEKQRKIDEFRQNRAISRAKMADEVLKENLRDLANIESNTKKREALEAQILRNQEHLQDLGVKIEGTMLRKKGIAFAITSNQAVLTKLTAREGDLLKKNEQFIRSKFKAILATRQATRDVILDEMKMRRVEATGDKRSILQEKHRQEIDRVKKKLAVDLQAIDMRKAAEHATAAEMQQLVDDKVASEMRAGEQIQSIQSRQQREAVKLDKDLIKEEKDKRDKEAEKNRKKELSQEEKLVSELRKKVASLRDMFALEKAIAAIQERRVQRVLDAQEKIRKLENERARIEKVLADGKTGDGVPVNVQAAENGAKALKTIADKLQTVNAELGNLQAKAGFKEVLAPPDERMQAELIAFMAKAIVAIKKFNEQKEQSFASVASRITATFTQAFTNILSNWCKLMTAMLEKAKVTGAAAATAFNPGGGPLPLAAADVGAAVGGAGLPADPGGAPVGGPALASGGGGSNTMHVTVENNVDSEILVSDMGRMLNQSHAEQGTV